MAKIVARNADIFAEGRDISGQLNSATIAITAEPPEVSSFGDLDRTRLADSLHDFEMSVAGYWDASASQIDELFNSLLGTATYYGFYPESASRGYVGREFQGIMTEYMIDSNVPDAAAVSSTTTGSSDVYRGQSLGYHYSSSAFNDSSVDNGAATEADVMAVIRILQLEASASISASFQDSPNDSAWTTEVDFGTISEADYFAASLLASASQYRRLIWSMGGSAVHMGFSGSHAQ